ncbi:hypothetical protein [Austwickia chelonae]|uniref:hypothetical protein n=1 Tax=Austwickia chelonae TaxID=100225 RepID=UPI001F07DB57|nr:hypothetical protein [Austwickia chelonae]
MEALVGAAEAVGQAVDSQRNNDVVDLVPMDSDVCHPVVWEALSEFMNRWEISIVSMTDDVAEISGRLSKVAATYAQFDAEGAARLKGSKGDVPVVPRPGA